MQRPFHLHFRMLFDPIEQHLHVDIVAMEIVQPKQIRLIFLSPLQKLFGCMLGAKSMRIKQPRLERVHLAVKICANTHCIFLKSFRHCALATIGDFDLVAFGFQLLCKVCANATRATNTAYRVDKKNFHTLPHLVHCIVVRCNALILYEIVIPQCCIIALMAVALQPQNNLFYIFRPICPSIFYSILFN